MALLKYLTVHFVPVPSQQKRYFSGNCFNCLQSEILLPLSRKFPLLEGIFTLNLRLLTSHFLT